MSTVHAYLPSILFHFGRRDSNMIYITVPMNQIIVHKLLPLSIVVDLVDLLRG